MRFDFEWDLKKAEANRKKHGISFEQAAHIFKDPRALSIFDEDHGGEEERWITIGMAATGAILVVHHTFVTADRETIVVRLISSRRATKAEKKQYAE